jgi:hypothetical protein
MPLPVTTFDVMVTPRWFRSLDATLLALWCGGVAYLAVRLVSPLIGGDQVALTFGDAAVLLGLVVATSLVRKLVLWPRAARAVTLEQPHQPAGWWPGSVRRFGADEVCATSWDALVALRLTSSWWSRYRVVALHHGLRGGVRRALASLAVVVGLTIPVFLLQQAIEYGSPRGQWVAAGFGAWARALVKSGLAVGVSAAVWWGVLSVVLQVTWALLAARERPADRAARWVWWGAWVAWAAVPLALVARQVA